MELAPPEVFDGLREFDTATIFNAVIEARGATQGGKELEAQGGVPMNYMGPEISSLLPHLGMAIGYAVTCELTTHDPDSPVIPWHNYYDYMDQTPGPLVAIMKDVDTMAGRGASLGDGMAASHKVCGVTGIVVDGSVRDLAGIETVGLPVWGTGLTPGHGILSLVSYNKPVTMGQLLIYPGEIVVADQDGVMKIPAGDDPIVVLEKAKEIQEREATYHQIFHQPGVTWEKVKQYQMAAKKNNS